MKKTGKIVLFSIIGLAAVGTGVYFFMKKKNSNSPSKDETSKELGTTNNEAKSTDTINGTNFNRNSQGNSRFAQRHPVLNRALGILPPVAIVRLSRAARERRAQRSNS